MTDIRHRDDIEVFVNSFYAKIRQDTQLAPVFGSRISEADWSTHLNRMYDFWHTVLFFQNAYKGNPFSKHIGLNVTPEHFEQWVRLFKAAIDENFEGVCAEDTKKRAETMAALFQSKMTYMAQKPTMLALV